MPRIFFKGRQNFARALVVESHEDKASKVGGPFRKRNGCCEVRLAMRSAANVSQQLRRLGATAQWKGSARFGVIRGAGDEARLDAVKICTLTPI